LPEGKLPPWLEVDLPPKQLGVRFESTLSYKLKKGHDSSPGNVPYFF